MRMPAGVKNPGLAVLIAGAGFPSLERFAEAVNVRAWTMHGVTIYYDHVQVKRWLAGSTCQYPDVVADVLSTAWGIPIPVGVLWPGLSDGGAPVPAHLQAWVPGRTLDDLGIFLRSDLLTRREALTDAVELAVGASFSDLIMRWLSMQTAEPLSRGVDRTDAPIDISTVHDLELATRYFQFSDAAIGGSVIREAAVGQLKYAVDLMTHGRFSEPVGERLLVAIADLANIIGWMSHDVGMEGPAQRYFIYALQAAREADDERANLCSIGILGDMARQLRSVGHSDTGLQLVDLALERLPADRRRWSTIRAGVWGLKARLLASMGTSYTPEVRNGINLAFDLHAAATNEQTDPVVADYFTYFGSDGELAGEAAACYRDLAREEPRFAAAAEEHVLRALAVRSDDFARSRVFDQIGLAQTRFLMREPEQACVDGTAAIEMATTLASFSTRVVGRFHELLADSAPYGDITAVREFRDQLQQAIAIS